jgi:UDP:flavonoid glycosyltransferase YjiC (YdhE family)
MSILNDSMQTNMAATRAHVVVCAMPFISHFIPMERISRSLLCRGYQVTFITGEDFRQQIEQSGAKCVVPSEWEDFNDEAAQKFTAQHLSKSFMEQENLNTIEFFIKFMPAQFEAIQSILASSVATESPIPVVVLPESSFLGALPFGLDATGLHPRGVVTVGILPVLAISLDTAPHGHGLLPDSSEEGRKRNRSLNKDFIDSLGSSQAELNKVLGQLGARGTNLYRHNAVMELSDIFLQLCPQGLEYPRVDAPPTLRFTGGLPRNDSAWSKPELPSWWNELESDSRQRHVVAVSQGTVARNYHDLIIPTLDALKDREDLLVVVALGKRGITLPATGLIPDNARVADWIPFDELLSLSSVFVTNGGYGSFQNALSRGVPLVIAAPHFADKMDIADRVEWSGTGINLRTGTPNREALRKAILDVLSEKRYKRRALEVQMEIESYDPMAIITAAIDELAGS